MTSAVVAHVSRAPWVINGRARTVLLARPERCSTLPASSARPLRGGDRVMAYAAAHCCVSIRMYTHWPVASDEARQAPHAKPRTRQDRCYSSPVCPRAICLPWHFIIWRLWLPVLVNKYRDACIHECRHPCVLGKLRRRAAGPSVHPCE